MTIEKNNIITLSDDKKYVVVSKVIYDDNKYLYLIDINDYSNIKFCLETKEKDQIKLIEINDQKLLDILIKKFAINVKDVYDQIKELLK